MKFGNYLKDKIISILIYLTFVIIIFLLLIAFKTNSSLNIAIISLLIAFEIINLLYDYFRKKNFYDTLKYNLDNLNKKFLISEMIKNPNFIEGQILYNALYDITKSMNEHINKYKFGLENFKEYIELWIHEVKTPLSGGLLMLHNNSKSDKKMGEVLNKINGYVEQVLYYVRSENPEKDFIIKKVNLNSIVKKVITNNKENFINKKISIKLENLDSNVYSDPKWLEFIINQIIQNSLKYSKNNNDSYIKIFCQTDDEIIKLTIEDNGIGIDKSDLPRIFEKSFTGKNGHNIDHSTGMGLYICKKLCDKLGTKIEAESTLNEFTKLIISFKVNKFYDVI